MILDSIDNINIFCERILKENGLFINGELYPNSRTRILFVLS